VIGGPFEFVDATWTPTRTRTTTPIIAMPETHRGMVLGLDSRTSPSGSTWLSLPDDVGSKRVPWRDEGCATYCRIATGEGEGEQHFARARLGG
jgi:hypothetical protein